MVIGYHASHEQLHPSVLLDAVQEAERVGFASAMCSDHFAPWSERQGHSGFAWAWLGAAMQSTRLPFGIVSAPGQRYHPAIVAQAIGTLGAMYPGRLRVALGSGEALNEHITGDRWPAKAERDARLLESVGVIRALLAGEEVSTDGRVRVDRARLWTLPEIAPELIGAAVSSETAARAASWADGLITVNQDHEKLKAIIDAYRGAGGRGRMTVQVHVSWASSDDEALAAAHDQWRTNVFGAPIAWNLELPEQFDAAAEFVPPDAVRETVRISADLGRYAGWIAEYLALGFDDVVLHQVGPDQRRFLDAFGSRVLPEFAEATAR